MTQSDVPQGWAQTTIDELLAPLRDGRILQHGWSPQCEKQPAGQGDWGVLKTTAIQMGAFEPQHNKRLPETLTAKPELEVRVGDLLLTCAGPRRRCGIPCLVRETRPRLILSGKMYRFRVFEDHVLPRYIEAFLMSTSAQAAIDLMKTGISDSGLNLTHGRFKTLSVRVAPRVEQLRIVTALGSYFSRLDDAVASLERVQRNLKRYRASVLKAAVEGRLVPTEAELSKSEGRAPISAPQIHEATATRNKRSGRLWGAGEIPPLTVDERRRLPDGWRWAKVIQLGPDPELVVQVGPMSMRSREFADHGVPVLNVGTIGWGEFREAKANHLPADLATRFGRYRVQPGDVIFTRSGSVGRCAVAKNRHRDWLITFHLLRVRTDPDICNPEYLRIVFEGAGHIRRQTEQGAIGTTRAGFNTRLLASLDIPLPPLGEQVRIVAKAHELISIARALERAAHEDISRSTRLRQSILKWAFEGKLVDQDPSDEPASVLLERIRAERAAGELKKPKRKTRRKKKATT